MSRRVNFTSASMDDVGGIKLPSIFSGYNWVNDRPGGNQRFHSEPRQRKDTLQYLAPAGAKRGAQTAAVLSDDGRAFLYRNRNNRGTPSGHSGEQIAPRQKSLPARKPTVSDRGLDVRKTNSASDRENIQNYRNAKQTVSIYLASPGAKDHDLGPETKQVIHGIRTRSHEENYLRSNKFASSWAKVRAENLALRDGSPSEMSPTRLSRDESHDSPHRDGSPSKYTDVSGGSGINPQHHRFVITKPRGRPPNRKLAKQRNKKLPLSGDYESPGRGSWEGSRETLGWNRDTGSQDTPSYGSDKGEANKDEGFEEERMARRRPAWNSSMNVIGNQPPSKVYLRKYENDLTFKPAITTKEEVYMAYVGQDRLGDAAVESDYDEIYCSWSDGERSDGSRSNSGSPGRSKERMLNKREARAYLKMTAVYGSDAFKNQRKQWFLEKLALAQDQKAKLDEERRKAEERKREEDRKKQQRQLNHVRQKFRKEQVHRFRTQYVTGRVLEHEQANRHEYGLPEDFDDGNLAPKDNTQDPGSENTPNIQNGTNEAPASQTRVNGHVAEDKENVPKNSQNVNGIQQKNNKANRRGVKDAARSNLQSNANKSIQQRESNKEEEKQKQRQEQQKSWYAAYERAPRSEVNKLPMDKGNVNNKLVRENGTGKALSIIKPDATKSQSVFGNKYGRGATSKGSENNTNRMAHNKSNNPPPEARDDDKQQPLGKEGGSSKNDGDIENGKSHYNSGGGNKSNGEFSQSGTNETNGAPQGDKKLLNSEKDTGPSLPHTKSHADTDNTREKKNNAPYLFAGHFRQEVDGAYHKLDTSKRQNQNNIDHGERPGEPPIVENEENSNKSQTLSKDKAEETKAKNPDSTKDTPVVSNTQKQLVQNMVNKSKGIRDSKTINSRQNPKPLRHETSNNQPSSNTHSSSNKSKEQKPAKPSVTALLALLEDNKPPERNQSLPTTSPVAQSSIKPVSDDNYKTTPEASSINKQPEPSQRYEASSTGKQPAPSQRSSANRPPTIQAPQKSPEQQRQPRPSGHGLGSRRATGSSGRSVGAAGNPKKLKGTAALTHLMFDANRGPSWDPHQKVPKMEGIDTVVIKTKDGKGQVVKQKKQVKDVVKDAEKLLNVPTDDTSRTGGTGKRPKSKRSSKIASPDITLGSDFDVEDDEDETVGDIFERLRKKYNIQIDSDEEDNP